MIRQSEGSTSKALSGLVAAVLELHDAIRDAVLEQISNAPEAGAARSRDGAGDVSYGIDVTAEDAIAAHLSTLPEPVVVISEGLGERVFPAGSDRSAAQFGLIVDPLDGTRELMYQKRSAFVLSAVVRETQEAPTLRDVVYGVMTEVPPLDQTIGVRAWAHRGSGAYVERWDLRQGTAISAPTRLATSTARTIRGGFAPFVHYFPGTHAAVGRIQDDVYGAVLGETDSLVPEVFDDSYISTGGQLLLLASGRYRLLVDARPLLQGLGKAPTLCAHPYDLAGALLIAEEAGAIVTDLDGQTVAYPLDTETDCGFMAYANRAIRDETEAAVKDALRGLRREQPPGPDEQGRRPAASRARSSRR